MVNSASNVKEPVHQGMWGVFEVFADTIVVCTLTALVILTTGVVDLQSGAVLAGVQDNALVGQAFTAAFGSFGPKFIAISILLFAYSTTLGWSHYGTKAVEYLFGTTGSRIYKVVFVCMTVVGATMKLGLAWDLSDTFNGLMMIPNLIGVLVLSGTVVDITRNYFDRRVKQGHRTHVVGFPGVPEAGGGRSRRRGSGAGKGRKRIKYPKARAVCE